MHGEKKNNKNTQYVERQIKATTEIPPDFCYHQWRQAHQNRTAKDVSDVS